MNKEIIQSILIQQKMKHENGKHVGKKTMYFCFRQKVSSKFHHKCSFINLLMIFKKKYIIKIIQWNEVTTDRRTNATFVKLNV